MRTPSVDALRFMIYVRVRRCAVVICHYQTVNNKKKVRIQIITFQKAECVIARSTALFSVYCKFFVINSRLTR